MSIRNFGLRELATWLRDRVEDRMREYGAGGPAFVRDGGSRQGAGSLEPIQLEAVDVRFQERDFDVLISFSLSQRPQCRYLMVFPSVWKGAVREMLSRIENGVEAHESWDPAVETVDLETADSFVTYLCAFFDEELWADDKGIPPCDEKRVSVIEYEW